jgi:hypothetical protein
VRRIGTRISWVVTLCAFTEDSTGSLPGCAPSIRARRQLEGGKHALSCKEECEPVRRRIAAWPRSSVAVSYVRTSPGSVGRAAWYGPSQVCDQTALHVRLLELVPDRSRRRREG